MRCLTAFFGTLVLAACGGPEPQQQRKANDDYVRSTAVTFEAPNAADPRVRLAHGERVAAVLGCTGCHGQDLTGEDWSAPGFGRLWTANLTRSVRQYSDAELVRIIETGARPDRQLWEMPSHLFTTLAPDDMAALTAFLRSKPARGPVHPPPCSRRVPGARLQRGP